MLNINFLALLKAEIQTHSKNKNFALSDVLNTRGPKMSQMLLKILHLQNPGKFRMKSSCFYPCFTLKSVKRAHNQIEIDTPK